MQAYRPTHFLVIVCTIFPFTLQAGGGAIRREDPKENGRSKGEKVVSASFESKVSSRLRTDGIGVPMNIFYPL